MAWSYLSCGGLSPVIHKNVLKDLSPHTTLVGMSVAYTLCTILLAIAYKNEIYEDWMHRMNHRHIAFIAFTAIVCGFLANMLYFYILKRHPSYIVSALIYSSPVFTLVIAYMFLGEYISLMGLLGVLFITTGVICIAFNQSSMHL
jgi:uncharacterized membrane protein